MSNQSHNYSEETPRMLENKKIFSKEYLQKLKSIKDEELRIQNINRLISLIHSDVIRQAETTNNTVYQFEMRHPHDKLYIKDMSDIITRLQDYYPDCIVKYTSLVRGRDGKMYDISMMDSNVLPFVDVNQKNNYIVIDWS